MSTLLIYGATGHIGRMAAGRAKALDLPFETGGRNRQHLVDLEAARRVLRGERQAGFTTPVNVVGIEFARSIAGTVITDEQHSSLRAAKFLSNEPARGLCGLDQPFAGHAVTRGG